MKPDTFTKLYVHAVFSPKGKNSLLTDSIRPNVHKYIYGILKEKKCFPVAINGTKNHIHILCGFPPSVAIADLLRDIKRSSTLFINERLNTYLKFSWQEGYGVFTVGYRELDRVYKYILSQEEHHARYSFKSEYVQLLKEEGCEFDPKYLYEFYEDDITGI
jgi:REP element-mobilizing transposase RayT